MRENKLILLIVVTGLVSWIALITWGLWPPPLKGNLKVENFGLVKVGMTQTEVEELLGGPPGNFGRYEGRGHGGTEEGSGQPPGSIERIWFNDDTKFEIFFEDDRVVGNHRRARYQQPRPHNMMERGWYQMMRTHRSWK